MRPGVRDRVPTEGLLLALAAGAAGALLALWLQPLLIALTPVAVVRLAETGIDGGVLVFTLDRGRTGGCHQPLPLAAPFRKRPRPWRGGPSRSTASRDGVEGRMNFIY